MPLSLPSRLALVVLSVLCSAAYLHTLQRRLPPRHRLLRLAAAAPVVAGCLAAPLLFDPAHETALVILSINPPWLTNCAVLGWALGRGPLAQPLPFRPFLAYMAAPALPAPPGTAAFRLDARAALAKAAALAAAAQALACRGLPPWLHGALQSIALFCFTSLGMEGAACVASLLSGRPARVPFARPYAAASVGDFWRRWNVVPGVKFRQLLYDPLCQPASAAAAAGGAGGRRHAPSPWRRAAGACAVFAASGAVHELAHWYLTGGRLSGWWMLFFALQGPLVCVEALLLTLCRQAGVRMPQAARTAATLLLLHAMAQKLFFPDLVASGAPARLLAHTRAALRLPGGACGAASPAAAAGA